MSILLAISGWDAEAWRREIEALLPDHRVATLNEPFDRASIRYALTWRHPPGALGNLRNLEAIFSLGAGVDHLFADPALPEAPIARIVDPDLTQRMSEWVVLHALAHLRQLRRYERQQRERVWLDDDHQPKASEVQVGLLGLGVLGRDAAAKLRALGFPVAGWSASQKAAPGIECFFGADGLKRLLAKTNILVALLPLTPATRGILDASLIAGLAQRGPLGGPILINAGRGALQVEADILAALDSGRAQGRLARRVRERAAARKLAPMDASRRLREPAQCGDLDAARHRRRGGGTDRGGRARRGAREPRRSPPGLLRRNPLDPLAVSCAGVSKGERGSPDGAGGRVRAVWAGAAIMGSSLYQWLEASRRLAGRDFAGGRRRGGSRPLSLPSIVLFDRHQVGFRSAPT